MKEKMKSFTLKTKVAAMTTFLALTAPIPSMIVFCDGPGSIVKGICDVIVKIFPYVGAFFIISGVFKMIMAYRQDNPEAIAGAAKDIVIGAVFVVFKVFVWDAISSLIFQGL